MMMIILMLFLCLQPNAITGRPQSSGSNTSCKAVNEEKGSCIPIQSCDSLYQLGKKASLFPDELELLRQSQCDRNEPSNVCCSDGTVGMIEPTSHTRTTSKARISARKCEEYKEFSFDKSYIKNSPGSLFEIKSSNCAVVSKAVIVGGSKVTPKELPHMALIGYNNFDVIKWSCGGSLISEQFVLTAAHCNRNNAKYVRLGEHDLSRTDEAASIDFDIMKRIPHTDYRHPYNDIMLFQLNRIVELNSAIRPICLPEQSVPVTEDAIVSGWGFTLDKRSDILLKVTLEIFSQSECNDKYSAYYIDFPKGIVETQMCAGWKKGNVRKDACSGDSGGPIFTLNDDDECIYTILGVVSIGPEMCGIQGHPSVYTRVYPFLDWIEKNVWPNQ